MAARRSQRRRSSSPVVKSKISLHGEANESQQHNPAIQDAESQHAHAQDKHEKSKPGEKVPQVAATVARGRRLTAPPVHAGLPNSSRRSSRSQSRPKTIGPSPPEGISEGPDEQPVEAARKATSDQIAECFRMYDANKDGKISREELRRVLRMIDIDGLFSEADVQTMMDECDASGDGHIDYAEFAAWLGQDVEPTVNSSKSMQLHTRFSHVVSEVETPAQALERCVLELHLGEQAALPPKPVEAYLEDTDLWIFSRKGEKVEDIRSSTEPTIVHQISPTMPAYRAGVRLGAYVVGVERQTVAVDSNSIERIIKCFGGGGGAQRRTLVKFVSSEEFKAHQIAKEALPALLEAVERARAACREKSEDYVAPSAAALIKYYGNEGLFPLSESGCVHAIDIDKVFHISDMLPECKMHLTKCSIGDAHIVAAERLGHLEVVRKEVLTDPDGIQETFYDLVAGETYFLVVIPGAKASLRDLEWRARMQREQEEARLADLPEHDCNKEQVPFALDVTTSQGEFDIKIDNRENRSLGLNTEIDVDNTCLRVEEVMFYGLVHTWNTLNPGKEVKHGDRILAINGSRGNGPELQSELRKKDILNIHIRRVDFSVGDAVLGLCQNGNWCNAKIAHDNLDGSFTLRWSNGLTEDTIKGPFELRKEDELQDVCHAHTTGTYWLAGSHNGRAMYQNAAGMLVNFHRAWRISRAEDSEFFFFSVPGATGLRPPQGYWPSPANPGRHAFACYHSGRVCRVCTLPCRQQDT